MFPHAAEQNGVAAAGDMQGLASGENWCRVNNNVGKLVTRPLEQLLEFRVPEQVPLHDA